MSEPKNILITRTDRIGDVILTLPMASVLKEKIPGCKVTFLLREYTSHLAKNNPYIDEVIILDETNGKTPFIKNHKLIKEKKFDTVFAVYPRFGLALMLFLSGIKTRIGSGYRWYSILYNTKIYEHRKFGEKHELTHNINLLKAVGIENDVTEKNCRFGLEPSQENKSKIEKYLKETGIDLSKPVVIFHPGSGGSAVDLPFAKMNYLIEKTCAMPGVNVIITGDKKETEICSALAKEKKVNNLCGQFNLGELTALIDKSLLLIANSTGPIHIAAALGKYVIGFFPKIKACSPVRWAPFTEKKHIFTPSIECTDCTRKQCKELDCMNSISEEEVMKAIQNIVTNK